MTADRTFKPNSRVIHNGRKATVRVIHRDRAMVQYDGSQRGEKLTLVSVQDLSPLPNPDVPRNTRMFWNGYLEGIHDYLEGGFYCQSLTGNDWSIGYRKGWEDAKAGNIRSVGNQPFIECGGTI